MRRRHEIHSRGPVPAGSYGGGKLKRTFNKVVDIVDFFDPDSDEPVFHPPRYCWPPAV